MYKYDHFDQSIVDARVAEFRDQVNRRIAGEITEDQFKPLRLMNGLYLQLHAYMLRVAIPYGTLDSRQMRMLAHIARKYDRDYGHFTTRQNIQYNWIKLEECADLLEELATVEMHAIQTSGNCIRNISSDQYAGAAADEVADPRPWAELLRQWSTFHPEFSYLPRKFKIAVIASPEDRAAMRLHDIGLELVRQNGELGARVFVGGGMGRTPMIAPEINPFVKADDLLSYIEACLRVYNRYGRRDNIYKARIKILVHEIGADEYRRQVAEEFAHVKTLGIDPPLAELERISAFFAPPAFDAADVEPDRSDPDFAVWLDQNVKPHKQAGYAIVNISLKPIGGIPGDATSAQIDVMADLAEQYGFDELRVTHAQNIVLPHVAKRDLHAVWQALREAQLAFKNEYGMYATEVASLVDFVTNAQVTIVERKDSSFMKYNKVYQTDMLKDTIIYRVIGSASAITKLRNQREDLFPEDFDPKSLLSVKYSQDSAFKMGTAVVEKNGIKVPVFEIKASNHAIFGDVYDQYKSYIKRLRTQELIVGSLTEPTLSGNWK